MYLALLLAAVLPGQTLAAPVPKAPELGYIFPPGGRAGTTVAVHLGGYDWTPDMQPFVLDRRVQLTPTGPPGPILVPPPPYWFGVKSRILALPMPREVPARLVIPANVGPGPIYWQAANANGCTAPGVFIVSNGSEVIEDERRKGPQLLPSLPVTVSGRIMKIEEVDRYRFVVARDGPITCELMARRLGARFLGVVEVRNGAGQVVADVAGTDGTDPSVTFAAKAGAEYVVSVRDIDFGGDRSYVYRLTITPGPRVVAALPAAGRRGETREVEFVGIGLARGSSQLESVTRRVTFPGDAAARSFDYRLETPWGTAPPFPLLLSDLPETARFPRHNKDDARLLLPAAVTGVLDQLDAEDHYFCAWKKGEVWSLALEARRIGSRLDVALAVLGPNGNELARSDDLSGTTDAGLKFAAPADGTYQIVVSDMAGKSGTRASTYRLVVRQPPDDFRLELVSQRVSVPIGGKLDLVVKAFRQGGFKGPIALTVKGLPEGVSALPNVTIPVDKATGVIPLQVAKDASASAGIVTVEGTANIGSATVIRAALAPTTVNLSARSPEENLVPQIVVASTMKPRFRGHPVDADTGRKVHRGTTFPADVIVERLDGFQGEIVLQMAAQQAYQIQGISGGDVVVPPGVGRTIYPCFMPEWLETTRTSRLGMIAVARAPDPKGKVRYLAAEITGFVTVTVEGALLKVNHEDDDLTVPAGQPFDVRLKVSRLAKLAEPVRLELRLPEELTGLLKAEPMVVGVDKEKIVFRITPAAELRGVHSVTIRGTALQDGKFPAISETTVSVEFQSAGRGPGR